MEYSSKILRQLKKNEDYFILTWNSGGNNFPPDSTATIKINGLSITTSITTDPLGNLTITLDTSNANAGHYFVTVTENMSIMTSFELDPTQPFRTQSGSGTVIVVPSGIGFTQSVFLPAVRK